MRRSFSLYATLRHVVLMSAFASSSCLAATQVTSTPPLELKARYINKVINSISWPESVRALPTFKTCLWTDNGTIEPKAYLSQVTFGRHAHEFSKINDLNQAQLCQVLYIDVKDDTKLSQVLNTLEVKPILLISDQAHFAEKGGHLNFVNINGELGMVLNTETIEKSGLVFDLKKFNNITIIPNPKDLPPIDMNKDKGKSVN